MSRYVHHMAHWGAFEAQSDGHRITHVRPYRHDPEPFALIDNLPAALHHPTRIDRPYARRGWLQGGPAPSDARGNEEFVALEWDEALTLLSAELTRVYGNYGSSAVYGGSYGWGSAGRFHHAQSQVHRFLNCAGGYVRSVDNYSFGASNVIVPYVIGSMSPAFDDNPSIEAIAEHSELVVAFGGLAYKNAANNGGGISRHQLKSGLITAYDKGVRFINISPIKDDFVEQAQAQWLAPRPGTDAALMLALAYVWINEGLHDKAFLASHCHGFEPFEAYVLGNDGVVKTPEWAAEKTELDADTIRLLARDMAAHRTLIITSWSIQRAQYGEQPIWLGIVLAAMLGQIGLPGCGFGHGYAGSFIAHAQRSIKLPALPQGKSPIDEFIPVARISDMLLNPGAPYSYKGEQRHYPDIKLVYWCGGNPFHHHQDLSRLTRAFQRPDTVVVHDSHWTATTRHADIVLPATMSVERDDFGAGIGEFELFAMKAVTAPYGEARDDYAIFSSLAQRLGFADSFTEGLSTQGWLERLYGRLRSELHERGDSAPDFQTFWQEEVLLLPTTQPPRSMLEAFRNDPLAHPLATPSGKIEIFSERIHALGYADCMGHPSWLEPEEWLGSPLAQTYPLHLIANNPKTRLHSQLDIGEHSQRSKVAGREPMRINSADASRRGLQSGDVAKVFNAKGSCLVGVVVCDDLRTGVVQLSTGAWYDPDEKGMCRHGNPNTLTTDRPASTLSQAPTGQHALVEVVKYEGVLDELTVLMPPKVSQR